jgi:hypothetical protein
MILLPSKFLLQKWKLISFTVVVIVTLGGIQSFRGQSSWNALPSPDAAFPPYPDRSIPSPSPSASTTSPGGAKLPNDILLAGASLLTRRSVLGLGDAGEDNNMGDAINEGDGGTPVAKAGGKSRIIGDGECSLGDVGPVLLLRCGSSGPNMLGFLCRFIGARVLGWLWRAPLLFSVLPCLLPSELLEGVEVDLLCVPLFLTPLEDFGLLAVLVSVQGAIPLGFALSGAFSLTGVTRGFDITTTGDGGAVTAMGEEGAEDGGEDTTEGVAGEGVKRAVPSVLVLSFLARLVLAFSSSSEEGYDPESCLTCLCFPVVAALRSCFASCAKAP